MRKLLMTVIGGLLALGANANTVTLSDAESNAVIERSLKVIKNQVGEFKTNTEALYAAAQNSCEDKLTLNADLAKVYASWVAIEMYHFGPIEQQSSTLAINFWPDKKGFVTKHLSQFDNLDDEAKKTVEGVRSLSVAAQGLPAMIELIKQNKCPELIGVAANLAKHGDEIYEGWFGDDGWADVMRTGGAGNAAYLTPQEAVAKMYSAVTYGLQRADMRLTQPMGTIQTPQPNRAEGGALSTMLITEQLISIQELVDGAFAPLASEDAKLQMDTAFKTAIERVNKIPVPLSETVTNPDNRIPVENAMQKIEAVSGVLAENLREFLGSDAGFTPADGD